MPHADLPCAIRVVGCVCSVAALARFFLRLCKPSQPHFVCSDEETALEYAACCTAAKRGAEGDAAVSTPPRPSRGSSRIAPAPLPPSYSVAGRTYPPIPPPLPLPPPLLDCTPLLQPAAAAGKRLGGKGGPLVMTPTPQVLLTVDREGLTVVRDDSG
eukprot:2221860-Prymnesium_polylepis.1